jgi:ribose 1,5-bisphosphokinase PhnN
VILLYIAGPPGAGKSTLMAELTRHCDRLTATGPVPHDLLCRPRDDDQNADVAVEIGRRRASFSGTDALGMSIQPRAIEWISTRPHPLVLAEGARLGTTGFLLAARRAGYRVILVHLYCPPAVLEQRRAQRGSNQNPVWMKGATTRALRLVERVQFDVEVHRLNARMDPAGLADEVIRTDRALEVLR